MSTFIIRDTPQPALITILRTRVKIYCGANKSEEQTVEEVDYIIRNNIGAFVFFVCTTLTAEKLEDLPIHIWSISEITRIEWASTYPITLMLTLKEHRRILPPLPSCVSLSLPLQTMAQLTPKDEAIMHAELALDRRSF